MSELDAKGRVPYKECVVLRGAGRDGERHACHPQVMGLLMVPKDPELKGEIELWLRTTDCDAEGHTQFMRVEDVMQPSDLAPPARCAIDWRKHRAA